MNQNRTQLAVSTPTEASNFGRPTAQQYLSRLGLIVVVALFGMFSGGCEVDSWFDPSTTGRFEHTAITIPILRRIDVIERGDDPWGDTSAPTAQDLLPGELTYRLIPGDAVTIGIYQLYVTGQWYTVTLRVDATGKIRLPELNEFEAAGLTAQELEDRITSLLSEDVLLNPLVDVSIAEASAFRYTIYGAVPAPGVFTLRSSDLRLLDALALAGGSPQVVKRIYVMRSVTLTEAASPDWKQQPPSGTGGAQPDNQQNIEELIDEIDRQNNNNRGANPGMVAPGAFAMQDDSTALVDIDDIAPVQRSRIGQVDIDDPGKFERPSVQPTFFYDQQRGEWVRVPGTGIATQPAAQMPGPANLEPDDLMALRVIEIDNERLLHGDSTQNVVIRPGDRIYVEVPLQGLVYIDGDINRRGVYQIPSNGELTLSRLVATAGGLNSIAIPERVDLTRRVGTNREATVRLDLAAIRNRTQPDVLLKPDDVIIIGTNFIATPLAVIRNGFRATYGWGFLLDRNFGADVFGAPPGQGNQF